MKRLRMTSVLVSLCIQLLLTIWLSLALFCFRSYAGDAILVKASKDAKDSGSALGSVGNSSVSEDSQSGGDEEEMPARLIEPEESETIAEVVSLKRILSTAVESPVPAFSRGTGRQRTPTLEQWKRIEDEILKKAPPEVPMVAKGALPKPPKKPLKKPPTRPPEKKLLTPLEEVMPTEKAVSLALEVGSEGLGKDYARVVVQSGRLAGNTESKSYYMQGDLLLFYRDITLSASRGMLDQNKETAELYDEVLVTDPNYELSADEVKVSFKDKTMDAQRFVRFKKTKEGKEPTGKDIAKRQRLINIFKNKPTQVLANRLEYNWETEEMKVSGEVKVLQDDFTAAMDELTYNPGTKLYTMKGNVFVTLHNMDFIFEHELVEKEDEDIAKALSEKESVLKADTVEFGEEESITRIKGSLKELAELSQADKRLRALVITIDDDNKLVTAQGDVEFYQESGEWLRKGGIVEEGAEEELKKRLEKPITSSSDFLSYDYDKRILRQWGNVELLSEDEALFCSELEYKEKDKLLTLRGGVTYYRGKEEYLFADEVTIDTARNVMKFVGPIEALVSAEKREGEETGKAEAEGEAQESLESPAPSEKSPSVPESPS